MKVLMQKLCAATGVDFDRDRWEDSVQRSFKRYIKTHVLVAEWESDVVGMAFARVLRQETGFKVGYLTSLIVDPAYRSRGVGEALVREAISTLRKCHLDTIRVTVKAKNPEAGKLFYKLGFEEKYRVMEFRI